MTEPLPHDPVAPDVIALDPRFGPLSALVARLSDLPVEKLLVYLVDAVDAQMLPELGRQFHVASIEGWHLANTDAARRALIKRSIAMHRKKGTPWALKEALKTVGVSPMAIEERLPARRYDGTINHAGADYYNAYGWAQFRVTADVGDDQPISAANTARVVDTINEWKPVRSHLVDVQYRASVTETVPSSESTTTAALLEQEDTHLLGRRLYDGSLAYNQGLLRTHEGAFAFNGAATYAGFTAAGECFDSEREQDEMAAVLALSDVQSRGAMFDGFGDYGGALDFGASAPVAEDPPMTITLTRHRRYDGRHSFAANRYDGSRRHTGGGFTYFGNIPYAGDVVTTLEA